MISNIKFYSGKDINLRESVPFVVIFVFVIIMAFVSYSPAEVLFGGAFIYALSGYAASLFKGKQN